MLHSNWNEQGNFKVNLIEQITVMQALLDFTLSSGYQWAAAVVFAFRFIEAALAEVASVLLWVAEGRLGAGAAIF